VAAPPRPAKSSEGAEDRVLTLEIGALIVPVLDGDRALAQAIVEVALGLEDGDRRREVMARIPRLRDAFFTSLYRLGAEGRFAGGTFDLDQLKRVFQRSADRIVGPGTVVVLILQAHLSRMRGNTGSGTREKTGQGRPAG
jgi:hypothetical protein